MVCLSPTSFLYLIKNESQLKIILKKAFKIIYVSAAILLLLSYISVHVSPEAIEFPAFAGLSYPVLIFLNFSFLIVLIIKKKKTALIPLIAILLGYNHISDFTSFNLLSGKSEESNIKILSYNVRMFNLYKWTDTQDSDSNIYAVLKKENADIICFQEFYTCRADKFSTYDSIAKLQNTVDYNISYTGYKNDKKRVYGTAIFSRFKMINKGFVDFDNKNKKCLYSDIVSPKDTLRIYNIHLASLHLGYDDYKFIDNIPKNGQDENVKGMFGILRKISAAYKNRASEAEIIAEHIKKSPYPVVLCGDFNDVPVSYTYRKLKGDLNDAHKESGFGIGTTYAGQIPFQRIDYIFHDSGIKSSNFKIIYEKYSDHYPISCELELN